LSGGDLGIFFDGDLLFGTDLDGDLGEVDSSSG
jgi:hypothetical protein